MFETNNTPEAIELRRRRNVLTIVGAGTILFGFWAILKRVGVLLLAREKYLPKIMDIVSSTGEKWSEWYYVLLIVMTVIAMSVELLIRAFVGWAAISEGHGKHRSILYLIAAFLLMWGSFTSMIDLAVDYRTELAGIFAGITPDPDKDTSMSAIIIEFTSMIMLAEMIYASVRVRILTGRSTKRKKQSKHEG